MKKYIILILICLAPLVLRAQVETVVKINYMPAIPLGETADFSNGLSPRGTELEVNRFLMEDLSIGLSAGWNVFREKVVDESFEYQDLLVTGTQFRYTNIVPLNVSLKKYFGSAELSPFIGIGLGTSYAKQTNNAGIFSFVDDQWQFNLAPEVGIQSMVSPDFMLSLKLKYSYSFESGDFPSMSYLALGLGIGIL
jgi:opacity protein-like surface antigen